MEVVYEATFPLVHITVRLKSFALWQVCWPKEGDIAFSGEIAIEPFRKKLIL
jgi:hypothetical protein